jgi:RND family efflux transporter MFP subunit
VADFEDFTGRTEARIRVDLRARVTGLLLKAAFQEGTDIRQGDVLFEIDPRAFQVELEKAQALVSLAEPRLQRAEADLKRAKALLDQKAIGQEEFDKIRAEKAEAEAKVRIARTGLDSARLNLSYTRVVAPISGRIGRRLLEPGNLVKADDTILATIVTRNPMYVYFDIDERTLVRLRKSAQEGKKLEKWPAAVGLPGEVGFPRSAVVDFADNQVNPNTGTLRLRAVLPNKDGLLDPGMFVRVRLTVGHPHMVLLVPAETVVAEDGARFVFVVNEKNVIEKRPVVLGQVHDGRRVITQGLKPEAQVVVGRLQGLRPGMAVRPVERDTPAPPPASSSGEPKPAIP